MAMNKQRRTSNINNIVVYDAAGNVTLPANLVVSAQLRLSNYTSGSSYPGTIVGFLAFDSSGNILTTSTPIANAITFNNAGSGDASGITYNGSAARTISYNTVGAAAASHIHDDRYLLYTTSSEVTNLAVGWYTIAVNAGDRASAKFILRDTSSGNHQSTVFYATHHFGNYSDITVLSNSRYSGDPFGNIRIKTGGTYDGALLQVYIDLSANTVKTWMLENIQTNGWVLKNWIPDGTDPGGLGNFAGLTVNSAEVNLVQIPNGGISTTGGIYGGGDTTQYLHLHTNNYNTYAPTLTGTGASGTWGISITGNAATATTAAVSNFLFTDNSVAFGRSGLQFAQSAGPAGNDPTAHQTPTGDWWHILRMNHANAAGYYADLAVSMTTNLGLARRVIGNGGQFSNWVTILDALNYNSYAPTLAGVGATGTWGINISGNALTATSTTLLKGLADYSWSQSTLAVSYPQGMQVAFVGPAAGEGSWQSYGTVINARGYSSGGGGSLQMYVPYSPANGGNALQVRFGNYEASGAWTAWKTLLQSDNYNSYAPTLTGGGASGTWGINITGNAATVTGGVYTTGDQLISGAKVFYSPTGNLINTTSAANQGLTVYQSTDSADAYMTFHIGGNYAGFFGLGGAEDDLVFGGWSAGNVRRRILHSGNFHNYALPLSGGTMSGNIIMGQNASPNTYYLQFGDNTGWVFRFMTLVSGTPTVRFSFQDNGNFTAVGDITAYSDVRVKTNIVTLTGSLEKVQQLRGVSYNRTDSTDTSEKLGVIAQEVQKILPQVVTEDKAGMLGVSYGNLAAVFIEAIKEQQAQIEDLKKQIQFIVENK